MKGSEIIVDSLKQEKVDKIFGYPGGAVIPIFDTLHSNRDIEVMLTRHEQGAVHAADGYARTTGKPGVCIVTSGPGATNTITGLATAKLDSIPVIVISGQVPTSYIGTDAFQETDFFGLSTSICKHNYLVKDIKNLPNIIKEAFHVATSGRPGPVTIDVPKDVSLAELPNYKYPKKVDMAGYQPVIEGNMKQIKKLAEAIKKSSKPVLYTGGGIVTSGAEKEIRKLVEKVNIPTTTTLMGLGTLPYDHPEFLGMPGMHGTVAANYALTECDLLIAIGTRFDDRVTGPPDTFAKNAKVAHVDIDPAEIGKIIETDIPVVGDAGDVLKKLINILEPKAKNGWNKKTQQWKSRYPLKYDQANSKEILPQYIIDTLNDLVDDAIMVTDVGQHQMWVAQFFHFKNSGQLLTSGGLGTMGYGLPAAMGAAASKPGKPVINVSGDGGFQMNIQELTTCALNNLPVKNILINNSYLGMVRQWQELFWDKRYAKTSLRKPGQNPEDNTPTNYCPDMVKLAEASGVKGLRANKPEDVEEVLKTGLEYDGPVVMEFFVRETENVYPMVPSGKPINEIILGDEQ
ncbi:MAG: biosynthetic-type acetolactate synthase large subunit [Candidatus Marinimicrobia bacterium]|nr:biosynthetic-type acetolactate synthase large subunit [Candidatus Neomarinimicrobiota bacterium]